ncbi:ubiquinone biosynthesis protein UbiA [Chloroflexus islandicus]|uniref:Ubiquinone biosynthesis protein UbiA n=1 Tax=Chloroflexus islandicus TaxID=1707952 RepID=A0A178M3Y6_9CHLR|nr:prenyltransferase [Chloroflexus islandicus]OAN42793.1 ubiquinone biosynthesis protein UbiA [Chloroflexus islandicus]
MVTNWLASTIDLIKLGRPLHLIGGAIFYGVGVAAAGSTLRDGGLALLGLATALSAQLMNHYSNDYFDHDADLANPTPTRWSGGSRVLPAGRLPAQAALAAAIGWGTLAIILAVLSAARSPNPALSAGVLGLAIALAWVYSGPPLYLHRRGWGEATGAVLVPGMTALAGFMLQTGTIQPIIILAIIPLCLLQFAMLVAVSLPDVAGDRVVGKRTLAVIVGPQRAAQWQTIAIGAAFAILPLLILGGVPWPVAVGPLATAPIGLWLISRLRAGAWAEPAAWDGLGFWSIGQLVGSAGMMVLGFVLSAWSQ